MNDSITDIKEYTISKAKLEGWKVERGIDRWYLRNPMGDSVWDSVGLMSEYDSQVIWERCYLWVIFTQEKNTV